MSNTIDKMIPDFGEYSLDSLLDGFQVPSSPQDTGMPPDEPQSPEEESAAERVEDAEAEAPGAASHESPEAESVPETMPAAAEQDEPAASQPESDTSAAENIAERSRRLVMNSLGRTLRDYRRASVSEQEPEQPQDEEKTEDTSQTESQHEVSQQEDIHTADASQEDVPPAGTPQEESEPEPPSAMPEISEPTITLPPPPPPRHPRVTKDENGIITLYYDDPDVVSAMEAILESAPAPEPEPEPEAEAEPEPEQEQDAESEPEQDGGQDSAEAHSATWEFDDFLNDADSTGESEGSEPDDRVRPKTTARKPKRRKRHRIASFSLRDSVLAPVIRILAMQVAKRDARRAEAARWPEPDKNRETPELSPLKAARFYSSQSKPLRMRCRICIVLTVILFWISLGLPMAGMLGHSLCIQAGVSLILLLVVMLTALDVIACGFRQLLELRLGAEALAALSALFSCIDAALILAGFGTALPFCVVAAAALTFALWGSRLACSARIRTFRTATASRTPSCVSSVPQDNGGSSLTRGERKTTHGIVHRSESQDICATSYAVASPILLLAAFLLSVIASIGQPDRFLHTFSALLAVSTSFAAFFSFSLPYAIASRRLRSTGVAIAGYEGCASLGKTRSIVITDEDLFPSGTMKFTEINALEGVFLGKVVGYTTCLLSAAESGAAALFEELVARRGYNVPEATSFTVFEGGGMYGIIGGDAVHVGSAAFMTLQGIRIPQNLPSKNAICTAMNGELIGVFVIEYIPYASVQEALVSLMRSKLEPIFAIRDFNITPQMIKQLFLLPTANFTFPPYRDRRRIAAGKELPPDAVLTRSGMLPLIEAAESGRRLYTTSRISTILSLVGSGIGLLILFLLCRTGDFATASAGNVFLFMLLWTLSSVILSLGRNR